MSPHLPGLLRKPCQVGVHVRQERRDRSRVAMFHPFLLTGMPWLGLARACLWTLFFFPRRFEFRVALGALLFQHVAVGPTRGWTGVELRPSQSVQGGG